MKLEWLFHRRARRSWPVLTGERFRASRRGGVFLAGLFFAAFLLAAAVLAWMLFLPRWVERVVEERTGYPISVGFLGCNPLGFVLKAEGVRIGSPESFAERGFIVLSSLRWEMDVGSLGKDVAVARDVEIRLERLVLGLDERGESNLQRFFEALDLPKMQIRRARLVVENVTLADDSGLRPQRRSYRANIDETLEDLSSPAQLFEPVFIDAVRLGFPQIMGRRGLGGSGAGAYGGGAENVVQDASK